MNTMLFTFDYLNVKKCSVVILIAAKLRLKHHHVI